MLREGSEPIPGYRLIRFLGRGQFGDVWESTAPGGTRAALKFIDLGRDGGVTEYRSIQRMKEIRHPHLTPITALWLLDDQLQLLDETAAEALDDTPVAAEGTMVAASATPYAPPRVLVIGMLKADQHVGQRLKECLSEGLTGIPIDELLSYMEEAAKGIDFLHESRHDLGEGPLAIQHCDIKPANLLLVGGSVMITDFGLARILTDATATSTNLAGSPAYMSPESVRRKPGRGSDQYSLAISYCHLRTGKLPVDNEDATSALQANLEGNLDFSALPEPEQQVMNKATAADASARYATTAEFVAALRQAIVPGVTSRAPAPESGASEGPAAASSHRSVWAALITLAVAGGLLSIAFSRGMWPFHQTAVVEPDDDKQKSDENSGDQQQADDGNGSADDTNDSIDGHTDDRSEPVEPAETAETAQTHLAAAFEWLNSGSRSEARESFQAAIALDNNLAAPTRIELVGLQGAVNKILFSNRFLIAIADSGEVGFWPLDVVGEKFDEPTIINSHTDPVVACSLSDDGRYLMTGSWDGSAKIWHLEQSPPFSTQALSVQHKADVVDVQIQSPPLRFLSASLDGTIAVNRIEKSALVSVATLTEHDSELERLAISDDGRWLVSTDADGRILRWDLQQEQLEQGFVELLEGGSRVGAMVVMQNRWLLVGDDSGKCSILDVLDPDGKRASHNAGDFATAFAVGGSTDEDQIILSGSGDGNVRRWTHTGGTLSESTLAKHTDHVSSVSVDTTGEVAASVSWDGNLFFWDLSESSAAPLSLNGDGRELNSVAISPNARWLAATGKTGKIWVWPVPHCRLVQWSPP